MAIFNLTNIGVFFTLFLCCKITVCVGDLGSPQFAKCFEACKIATKEPPGDPPNAVVYACCDTTTADDFDETLCRMTTQSTCLWQKS